MLKWTKMKITVFSFGIFLAIVLGFFYQFFIFKKVPIPGDILLGSYYPWLNSHWGFTTGVPVKNPLMSDIVSLMYPWRYTAINYIKGGNLPLWDPSSFFGTSLIGNFQAGIFNPFNVIFLLPLSFNIAWGIQVIIQPFLAMISMFFLLKHWKLSHKAVLFGSLSYGLSGPLITWMEYNVLGFSIAVLPLMFLFVEKFLQSRRIRFLLGISAVLVFVVFAGYPQFLYYFLVFPFLYFIYLIKRCSKVEISKKIFFYGLFVLLGFCIAAIQLIPGLEMLHYSIRYVDKVALSNSVSTMPLKNFLMGIIPDYFGNPATYNYWGGGYYESFVFYTSLVALFFTPLAIKNKPHFQKSIFLIGLAALSVLLSLTSPLTNLIQNLSFLGLKGSVASRILFVFSFSISSLGAIGMDLFIKKETVTNKFIKQYLIIPLLTLIIISITILLYMLIKMGYLRSINLADITIALKNSLWPFIVLVSTCIFVFLFSRFKKGVFIYALMLLLILDMFRFGWKYLPFSAENQIFPTTPILSFLKSQNKPYRVAIEATNLLTANTWSVYSLESPAGYNILLPLDTADTIGFSNFGQMNRGNARFLNISNFNSNIINITNTRDFIFLVPDKNNKINGALPDYLKDNKNYKIIYQEGPVVLIQNNEALDRVYTVSNYKVLPQLKDALSYISSSNFNYKNDVSLNQDPHLSDLAACMVKLTSYNGEALSAVANCKKGSILVVSNAYHPGWVATINNKETKVFRANGNFLAVVLPKGEDRISLKFEPSSFWIGLWISIGSLIIALGLFYFDFSLKTSPQD